jgi:hypothetical protein
MGMKSIALCQKSGQVCLDECVREKILEQNVWECYYRHRYPPLWSIATDTSKTSGKCLKDGGSGALHPEMPMELLFLQGMSGFHPS